MLRYPALEAVLRRRDLDKVADASGVPAEVIRSWTPGGLAATPTQKDLIARVLRRNATTLFRLDPELQPALDDAPSPYVRDQGALRIINGRRS